RKIVARPFDFQALGAYRPLALQPPILGRLQLSLAASEFGLGRGRSLARLLEPPPQGLDLRGRPPVGVARLAPLLPGDAAAQQLEPAPGFGGLASDGRLATDDLQPWLDLAAEVF